MAETGPHLTLEARLKVMLVTSSEPFSHITAPARLFLEDTLRTVGMFHVRAS